MTVNRFRFRAYVKAINKLVDVEILHPEYIQDYKGNLYTTYELMQSTGLVDKNGKEIFEGDIIKSDFLGIGIINYSENLKRFTVINPNYADEEDYCSDMTWDDFIEEFNKNQYEVVGNIYENPELLEEFRKKLKEFEKKLEIFMKNLNF